MLETVKLCSKVVKPVTKFLIYSASTFWQNKENCNKNKNKNMVTLGSKSLKLMSLS